MDEASGSDIGYFLSGAECFQLDLSGVILIIPVRKDNHRGFFARTYSQSDYADLDVKVYFVQDSDSLSASVGTVR